MKVFKDIFNNSVRLTNERQAHLENNHPELDNQIKNIQECLESPDQIVGSSIDPDVNLYY